jgi:RNA polymerase-associated protein RTF1
VSHAGPHSSGSGAVAEIRLEALPEIEREEILAARAEEMQKYKDSMALNAMYKMTGAGGAEASEDDGEGPSRKRRELRRVTLEKQIANRQASTRV